MSWFVCGRCGPLGDRRLCSRGGRSSLLLSRGWRGKRVSVDWVLGGEGWNRVKKRRGGSAYSVADVFGQGVIRIELSDDG